MCARNSKETLSPKCLMEKAELKDNCQNKIGLAGVGGCHHSPRESIVVVVVVDRCAANNEKWQRPGCFSKTFVSRKFADRSVV